MQTVEEIIREARRLVAHGWTQNTLYEWNGRKCLRCAVGALCFAATGNEGILHDAIVGTPEDLEHAHNGPALAEAIIRVTQVALGPSWDWSIDEPFWNDLVWWNDLLDRTQDEVWQVMLRAAPSPDREAA